MRFEIGSRVKVKSKEWYEQNKERDTERVVLDGIYFTREMSNLCGQIVTINRIHNRLIDIIEDNGARAWVKQMFEETLDDEVFKPTIEVPGEVQVLNSTTKRKSIYISGKVSGIPLPDVELKFKKASDMVRGLGFEPVNPLLVVPYKPELTWEDYMKGDLKAMIDCHGVLMLPDWVYSKGAEMERDFALKLKIPVFYKPEEIV